MYLICLFYVNKITCVTNFVLNSRHAAVVISGTELARQIHREIQRDVEDLVAQGNLRPHLGVVLVGDDPASRTYVRNKTRAASILGQIRAVCAFLNTTNPITIDKHILLSKNIAV